MSKDYPDPTSKDLASHDFNIIWAAIKGWDIARGEGVPDGRLYAGANGNDVMHILGKLRAGAMTIEDARGIAARAWCKPSTAKIEMDVVLAEEFAKILMAHTT